MLSLRSARAMCVAAAVVCGAVAGAAEGSPKLRVGIGGDYAYPYRFVPSAFLGVLVPVNKELHIGGRLGGFSASNTTVGGFFDLDVRYSLTDLFYVGAVGGPWYVLDPAGTLRIHAAGQVGMHLGPISLGLEAGWLQPGAAAVAGPYLPQGVIAGLRLILSP